jgi:hypothetical protein
MENINDLPLYKRLGIKEGFEIKLINEPNDFKNMLGGELPKIYFHKTLKSSVDLIHLFTYSRKELSIEFPFLKDYIKNEGVFCVSWPKNTLNFISDLDEETVRQFGEINGLVNARSFVIDDYWTAMKFTKSRSN